MKKIFNALIIIASVYIICFVFFIILSPYYLDMYTATVRFETNCEQTIPPLQVKKNTLLAEPKGLVKTGHKLINWQVDNQIWDFQSDVVSKDITLYANWEIGTYQIDFVTFEGSKVDSIKIEYDTYLPLPPNPTLKYNHFLGWYEDEHYSKRFDFNQKISQDYTLYAKYEFDVTYLKYSKLYDAITLKGVEQINDPFVMYLPCLIDGLSIVKIADYAFEDTLIEKISGQPTITYIGEGAFYNTGKLQEVINFRELKTISDYAFFNSAIKKIELGEKLNYLGQFSFANASNLAQFTLPTSLETIEDYTFFNCTNLSILTTTNYLKNIGVRALEGCYNLKMIVLYEELTKIGDYAFKGCKGLNQLIITKNVNYVGQGAFAEWGSDQNVKVLGETIRLTSWHTLWQEGCQATISFL